MKPDLSVVRDKSALIVKLGQIGDVIMAVPAVYELWQQGYTIDWICGEASCSILNCYSWIHVIPINDKAILFGSPLDRIKAIASLWKKVAFRRYDLSAILYYDRRYRLLTLPASSRREIILAKGSRDTALLPGRHHVDEYRRCLLQTEDSCRTQSAPPVRPDCLPDSPLPSKAGARRIALVAGGVNHLIREQATGRVPEQVLRRWPIECYVLLARQLLARGWEIVLLGGPDDKWVRPYFEQLAVVDVIGTLTLPQVVSLCDSCDAVVTHDTGPLHLAGLSTTCIVGIFGPTDPSTRVPRRNSVVGIWGGQGFACRPCYDGQQFAPCQFNGCMHQVTPDLVLHELDRLLEEKAAGIPKPWRVTSPEGSPITE
jgi:heptosyltransferase-2